MDIRNIKSLIFFVLMVIAIGCSQDQNTSPAQPPNIVYILADDLGYGEIGVYGQEKIETPNIDALARNGMKFTQHYSGSPVCAPARYMLMTGKHPGNAYVRGNNSMPERGDVWDFEAMYENPELEGNVPIPDETVTLAEVLKEDGYRTGLVGKWGLGAPFTEGLPNRQGFDYFYGYVCQRQAHTYYPSHLWKNEERVHLDNELIDPHQDLPEDADPRDPAAYARFHEQPDYAAALMGEEVLRFIGDQSGGEDAPFFLYYATPIPHASLQAPERWIEHYRQKFGEEEPYTEGNYVPVRYPRATYAAMISYLDEQVGQIVDKLKDLGLYENTLIVFTSDNGPANCCGVDVDYFDSAAPFQNMRGRVKGSVHEGGIRVPMIATWEGHIEAGSRTDHLSAFWDVMPTVSELVGVEPPEDIDGISFAPVLQGNAQEQEHHEYLYWEYPSSGGQQAVRMGRWKGIRPDIFEGNLEIELYNLEEDIREENNIADEHPEIVDRMRNIMKREHTEPELERFRMEALDVN